MPRRLFSLLNAFGPLIGLGFVYAVFLAVAPASFHTLYNTKTFVTQAVIYGIGALGMTIVIVSGGIDLSVGSLVALGTVVTALVIRKFGGEQPGMWVPLLGALAGIAVCGLCGLINGVLIAGLRIVPFIVTLGTMQIARGVAKGLAGSTTVNPSDNWINHLMVVEPRAGIWYSLAPGVWIMLALAVATSGLLLLTVFGRRVYALGSNETAARLCGVRVGLMRLAVYGLGGLFAGIAGVMQFSNLTLGDPTAAIGMELDIIAAVVIGGGSLSGGEGGAAGSIIGALLMALLRNGCNLVHIPNYVQNIVVGAIIIVAVALDRIKHRRRAI